VVFAAQAGSLSTSREETRHVTEFGVFFIAPLRNQPDQQSVFDDTLEEMQLAEELGFDAMWMAEHHFDADFCLSPSPNLFLAAAASVTSRIRIGCGINVLPFHHPVRVAEEGAMLDRLSHGRFNWGIGRGITGDEFPAFGVDPSETRAIFTEMHDAVTTAWQSGVMEHAGRFVRVPPTEIQPRPVQDPIPVWVTAQSPDSVAWAAHHDYPAMQIGESLDQGRAQVETYRKAAADAGVDVVRGGIVPLRQVFVASTDDDARARCEGRTQEFWDAAARTTAPRPKGPSADAKGYEYWQTSNPDQYGNRSYEALNELGLILTGSSATVRRLMERQVEALECKHVMLDFWRPSPREDRMEAMRRFAGDVIPAFK
jgi:alkanesulfonate monooxygenase SsuD/methylene tetrahydromethanopterin reductase-like flavin-dependent oxidoreductase (luciferase family)